MSRLEEYAKRHKKEETISAATRLPQRTYKAFKKHCEGLGLTISQGLAVLVNEELKSVNNYVNKSIDETKTKIETEQKTNLQTNVNILRAAPAAQRPKRASSSNGERFNTKEFQIGNMIACPLCRKWTSNKNKSRHFRDDHTPSTNTFDVYTNKELAEIARQMVAERLQNT